MKSHNTSSRKMSLRQKIGWFVLLLLAIYPVLISLDYLSFNPENFKFTDQRAVYTAHLAMLMTHIIASMLVILIGPFQFLPALRKGRRTKFHRWLGRAYMIGILVGGVSGLYMAQFAYGGLISHLGFSALACLWLYTGYRAYRHIRAKEVEQHRRWMIRNYALTFAGVMLRIWVPVALVLGFDFQMAYRAIAWLCWVPNLLVAQWIINRRISSKPRSRTIHRRGQPEGQPEAAVTNS